MARFFDLSKLSKAERDALPSSAFVFPKTRDFPINDLAHAKAALRLAGRESPEREAKVRAAVFAKYPKLKPQE
ncbi:MAG: hypothetical protein ACRDQA_14250 [Nocardioidaceae bacterium]